ncbi:hypothetical protein BDQ17DRAFT_1480902 [Cyathus striatus]|nr:hypothetical protein BDQ17DRAFT_1480902 [Cyathus striatus]
MPTSTDRLLELATKALIDKSIDTQEKEQERPQAGLYPSDKNQSQSGLKGEENPTKGALREDATSPTLCQKNERTERTSLTITLPPNPRPTTITIKIPPMLLSSSKSQVHTDTHKTVEHGAKTPKTSITKCEKSRSCEIRTVEKKREDGRAVNDSEAEEPIYIKFKVPKNFVMANLPETNVKKPRSQRRCKAGSKLTSKGTKRRAVDAISCQSNYPAECSVPKGTKRKRSTEEEGPRTKRIKKSQQC